MNLISTTTIIASLFFFIAFVERGCETLVFFRFCFTKQLPRACAETSRLTTQHKMIPDGQPSTEGSTRKKGTELSPDQRATLYRKRQAGKSYSTIAT